MRMKSAQAPPSLSRRWADTVATTQWLPLTCHDGSRETGHLVDIACLVQPLKQTIDESEGFLVVIKIHFSFPFSFLWLMNTYNTPQWRERENNGGTWVNWTANNSKISRVSAMTHEQMPLLPMPTYPLPYTWAGSQLALLMSLELRFERLTKAAVAMSFYM